MLILLQMQADQSREQQNPAELNRLLLTVADGDRAALAELYDRTRAAVYGLVLSYLKNARDAQDVTQDTFVRVWENAWQYRAKGSAMGWLLTVARNLALMQLRRRTRENPVDAEWDAIPDPGPAVSAEDQQILQTALATLNDQERQVVLLHAVTGLKHREIASLLELPLPTVLSKYHRALKKLKVYLEGENTQ